MAIVENPQPAKERDIIVVEEDTQLIDPIETNVLPAFSTSPNIGLSFGDKIKK